MDRPPRVLESLAQGGDGALGRSSKPTRDGTRRRDRRAPPRSPRRRGRASRRRLPCLRRRASAWRLARYAVQAKSKVGTEPRPAASRTAGTSRYRAGGERSPASDPRRRPARGSTRAGRTGRRASSSRVETTSIARLRTLSSSLARRWRRDCLVSWENKPAGPLGNGGAIGELDCTVPVRERARRWPGRPT